MNLSLQEAERRDNTRFFKEPGTEVAYLSTAGETVRVEVKEESLSGIGVIVPGTFPAVRNSEVTVAYCGEEVMAVVRHSTLLDDGSKLLGICYRVDV